MSDQVLQIGVNPPQDMIDVSQRQPFPTMCETILCYAPSGYWIARWSKRNSRWEHLNGDEIRLAMWYWLYLQRG